MQCSEICGVQHGFMVREKATFASGPDGPDNSPRIITVSDLNTLRNLVSNIACPLKGELLPNKDGRVFSELLLSWLKLDCLNSIWLATQTWVFSLPWYGLYRTTVIEGIKQWQKGWWSGAIINCFEPKSREPKRAITAKTRTLGSPSIGNFHGDRGTIVPCLGLQWSPSLGRVPEISLTRSRGYCGGYRNEVPPKLVSLLEFCSKYPNKIVDRNIFNLLLIPEMYLLAYHKLKSNPGNMTPGLSPETLDGLDAKWIDDVINKLKDGSFNFSPARRILIPKPNGKLRPLTIASPRDKLVQEVMRMMLEAIFEPTFLECSHGFRPNKGCHSAIKHVDESFKSSTWIIEGDIKGCFDNFDHDVLLNILRTKINDQRFLKLVRKALTVGYGQPGKIAPYNIIGTPQGSIISPILCNIYMHEFDKFVLSIKAEFDLGSRAARNPIYHRAATAATRAKQKGDPKYFELIKQLRHTPYTLFNDGSYKRLAYCRYADDWIIGIRGPLTDSEQILNRVTDFLKSTLKLDVSPDKTKITCLNKDKALFLGALISRSHHEIIKRTSRRVNTSTEAKAIRTIHMRAGKILRFEAPINRIRDKLTNAGFIRKSRPNPKNIWIALDKDQIISLYNSVLRGYLNYYRFAANYSNMVSFVRWVIYFSCARTLAAKFNSSVAKIVDKFGKDFRGDSKIGLLTPSYSGYSGAKRFATKEYEANSSIKALYARAKSMARLYDLTCSICQSTHKVEMPHVRHLKDLNPQARMVDKLMSIAKRKQITLCRSCHMDVHYPNRKKKLTAETINFVIQNHSEDQEISESRMT